MTFFSLSLNWKTGRYIKENKNAKLLVFHLKKTKVIFWGYTEKIHSG